MKSIYENANTLARDGETLGVLAYLQGGEKGEEKEAKLGLVCCHGGTATPCPVHRHPYGGDRLGGREQRVGLGAPLPCPVLLSPLGRCPPGLGRERAEWELAPPLTMYTTPRVTVHRQCVSGATATFF